jgi:dihydroneopterin aldolase
MKDSGEKPVVISIEGLELFAHHGLLPEERRVGQLFRFDIRLKLAACPACESDDIGGTVDYAQVADCVAAVSASRDFNLLEGLAAAAADAIIERFAGVMLAAVRVSKSSPAMSHSVDKVAVTVKRQRPAGRS